MSIAPKNSLCPFFVQIFDSFFVNVLSGILFGCQCVSLKFYSVSNRFITNGEKNSKNLTSHSHIKILLKSAVTELTRCRLVVSEFRDYYYHRVLCSL